MKTPPRGQKRPNAGPSRARGKDDEADSAARQLLRGREVEFWGVALVSAALLLALSLWVGFAGPLGRVIDTTFGWLFGLGRFPLPLVVGGIGVAMVRRRSVEHRVRLAIGWTIIALTLLGVLHLVNGERSIVAEVDAMSQAGGWLGALVCEPMRSTLGWAGALVVLLAVALGGVMIVTASTLPELTRRFSEWLRGGAIDDIEDDDAVSDDSAAREGRTARRGIIDARPRDERAMAPRIYDIEVDEEPEENPRPAGRRRPPDAEQSPAVKTPEFVGRSTAKVDSNEPARATTATGSGTWTLPPLGLLGVTEAQEINVARVADRGRLLEEALASHGVDTRLVDRTVGPTVTRYELELGAGVKVSKVVNLGRDIAYSMAATDVRILAPIPGKSRIGVEVPNETRQLVSLGDLMVSDEAREAQHPLDVAVGKDIAGKAVFLNLASTPHLLIAGATGAGKSSGINSILTSLLMRTTPDEVRLILIDPKQVEMGQYAKLPHLLTAPVTNPKKAANALGWAVKEMEKRYDLLVEAGYRDIGGYNAAFDRGELEAPEGEGKRGFERMPFIVVVVDELNDLMMVAARDVEESITRIAQKARAVGIHLIVATQRPSVNVITGVIKANIPARMAFAVSSLTDSRVILDQPGAEKLVGRGDMLLMPGNTNVAQRVQGSWVEEDEVRKVVAHWRRQAPEVVYVSGIEGEDAGVPGGQGGLFGSSDEDDLVVRAMEIVVRSGMGSTSLLQRKLKVGFARAGRLMDELEERGVVGPSEGSKARAVLMSVEELEEMLGR
ncbi:MAG: translocase FtsK [Actinomycetota bacterium]